MQVILTVILSRSTASTVQVPPFFVPSKYATCLQIHTHYPANQSNTTTQLLFKLTSLVLCHVFSCHGYVWYFSHICIVEIVYVLHTAEPQYGLGDQ